MAIENLQKAVDFSTFNCSYSLLAIHSQRENGWNFNLKIIAGYLIHVMEIWRFFLNFDRIMASENLQKKGLDFSTFKFKNRFWVQIARKKGWNFNLLLLLATWTMYRNLVILLKISSNYGYWKSLKKKLILALIIFNIAFRLYIYIYIQPAKRLKCCLIEPCIKIWRFLWLSG